jgi:single-stranded-DNA-specific exonuclease
MPPARWVIPENNPECEERLTRETAVGAITARVLVARGYSDPSSARRFLRPSVDDLSDPFLLAGMRVAVDRLLAAVARKEKILIYGDYDADGTTAVVILYKALELAGGAVSFHVPHRLRDGYGMQPGVIEDAARDGVGLIVSVDTGIRANDVVRQARDLGIDVIITDHHLPDHELPPALAVLNPNRPGCGYPDKRLCGAGVAFQLARALFGSLGWSEKKVRALVHSFLKMAAIATVADVVPLLGENRIIVKNGLRGLQDARNPGLRALLDVAGFPGSTPCTASGIAFRVAPRINAAGRMANARDVIEMFLTADPDRARAIAGQLHELNHERQQTEAAIVRTILEECERIPVSEKDAALIFSGEKWHRGVVGIVASRLVERFYRPVVVLGVEGAEASGSGRSIPGFHLLEALESMADLFTRFGGHKQAAGLTLTADRVPELRERLNAFARARLTREDLLPTLEIDAALNIGDLNDGAVAEILDLAPFGFGNPAPLFVANGVEVASSPTLFGDKNLRVSVKQDGRFLTMKGWGFAERAGELPRGRRVDIVFEVNHDPYAQARGWGTWSTTLKDVREAGSAALAYSARNV